MIEELKVLEFTGTYTSFGARILADLGAFVIRIEDPKFREKKDPLFLFHNLNKYVTRLDIKHEEAKNLLLEFIRKVDIFVTDKDPSYIEENGLGYEALKKINPKLIYISVIGTKRNLPVDDTILSALSGHMYVTGKKHGLPLKLACNQTLYVGALYIALASLLSYLKRLEEKKGLFVELILEECAISVAEDLLIFYLTQGLIPEREGYLSRDKTFCIIPCKDGYIQMTLLYQLETLIEMMEDDGIKLKAPFNSEKEAQKNFRRILKLVEKWAKLYKKRELFEKGQSMRFPWAPIFSPSDLSKLPHLKSRNFFLRKRGLIFPSKPYRFKNFVKNIKLPSPKDDERFLFSTLLGLGKKELERLKRLGIIYDS